MPSYVIGRMQYWALLMCEELQSNRPWARISGEWEDNYVSSDIWTGGQDIVVTTYTVAPLPNKRSSFSFTFQLCNSNQFQETYLRTTAFFLLVSLADYLYPHFYARKQLLLSARLSHRNSVRPSVSRVDQSKTVQVMITKFCRRLPGRLLFQEP